MTNYYVASFSWGVAAKVLNALFGVISVPILLKSFNIENYGVLTLATSVNAYMHLLDLGIYVGSVKFFSQWLYEGKNKLLESVARTSLSFYGIIGIVNACVLFFLYFYGRSFFNITDSQFALLQKLFLIAAFFSIINWCSTVFSQLLTAAQKISFVHKMMCAVALLKILLVYATLFWSLSVELYFFFFSAFLAALIFPYAYLCKKMHLLSSLRPSFEWNKFRIVFTYSISVFVLNFFQMCATSSRPIILGMFANDAATSVAHYNIVQLMPSFILSINGILSSLLLPKASVIAAKNDMMLTKNYLQKGTKVSSILCMSMCVPIILCANGLLTFIVGSEYTGLSLWLIIMVLSFCVNLPTTTCYSMVLAIGKTKKIVWATAIFCIISMAVNICFASRIGIGSAIIAYFLFVLGVCFYNYGFYYPNLFHIRIRELVKPIVKPFVLGVIPAFFVDYLFRSIDYSILSRFECLFYCAVISALWFFLYGILLFVFKEFSLKEIASRLHK